MKYPSMILREKCLSFDVSADDNLKINIMSTNLKGDGGEHLENHTTFLQPTGAMEHKFTFLQWGINFFILEADSENYLVAFACKNFPFKIAHIQMVWIWSRNQELEETYVEQALEVLNKFNISTAPLEKTDRGLCY